MALQNVMMIDNGKVISGGGGGGGTTDYDDLENQPQINGVTLSGNKSSSDLNIPKNFQGTITEWNALTTAEKKAYDHASILDSIDGGVTFPANRVVMTGGGNVEDALNGLKYENPSSKISVTLESGLTKDYFIIRTLGNLMVAQVRVLWNTPSTAETKIATLNGFAQSAYLTGVVLAPNTTQIGNFILSGNQLYIKLTQTISSSTKICLTIIGFNT